MLGRLHGEESPRLALFRGSTAGPEAARIAFMNGVNLWLLFAAVWVGAGLVVVGLYGLIRWMDALPPGSSGRRRLRAVALLLVLAVFVIGTLGGIARLGRKIHQWQGSNVAPVEADRPID